jgi:hypothetical protein
VKVDIPLEVHLPPLTWDMHQYSEAPRLRLPWIPVDTRRDSFREVELSAPEQDIRAECRRCLRCDLEWGQFQQGVQKVGAQGIT